MACSALLVALSLAAARAQNTLARNPVVGTCPACTGDVAPTSVCVPTGTWVNPLTSVVSQNPAGYSPNAILLNSPSGGLQDRTTAPSCVDDGSGNAPSPAALGLAVKVNFKNIGADTIAVFVGDGASRLRRRAHRSKTYTVPGALDTAHCARNPHHTDNRLAKLRRPV
jgi:hypothetical protein